MSNYFAHLLTLVYCILFPVCGISIICFYSLPVISELHVKRFVAQVVSGPDIQSGLSNVDDFFYFLESINVWIKFYSIESRSSLKLSTF